MIVLCGQIDLVGHLRVAVGHRAAGGGKGDGAAGSTSEDARRVENGQQREDNDGDYIKRTGGGN